MRRVCIGTTGTGIHCLLHCPLVLCPFSAYMVFTYNCQCIFIIRCSICWPMIAPRRGPRFVSVSTRSLGRMSKAQACALSRPRQSLKPFSPRVRAIEWYASNGGFLSHLTICLPVFVVSSDPCQAPLFNFQVVALQRTCMLSINMHPCR